MNINFNAITKQDIRLAYVILAEHKVHTYSIGRKGSGKDEYKRGGYAWCKGSGKDER
jgi:hypothetical protein